MKIKIDNKDFSTDEIDIILINETSWIAGPLSYFITIFSKSSSYSCFKARNHTYVQDIIKSIHVSFQENSINNFALLDNQFLINMENTKELEHYSNLAGNHIVVASFEDGKDLNIYEGSSKRYARSLITSYKEQLSLFDTTKTFVQKI